MPNITSRRDRVAKLRQVDVLTAGRWLNWIRPSVSLSGDVYWRYSGRIKDLAT